MAIYPAQIDNVNTLPTVVDTVTPVAGDVVNRLRDAIFQIEAELGVQPSSVYATVRNRLDVLEQTVNGVSGGGNVVSNGSATIGQALIWNGTFWIPSTNFINQNLLTSGEIMSGPALSTTNTTGLNQVTGKLILNGIATLNISDPGQGIIYFDENSNQFLLSQNGNPYVPLNNAGGPAGGDLTGHYPNPTIASIKGVAVPFTGPSAIGNVLQAGSLGALEYAPVNLAGGDGYVIGLLPISKQANQVLGGDLSGTTADGYVIGIQGVPVSATHPTSSQVLQYNGSFWAPSTFAAVLVGDVTGPYNSNTVVNIHGASVPAAGSLTAGNILQVGGSSTLTYGPLNLGGGSNYVTGVLPVINLPSLAGDVTGTFSATAVGAVTGVGGFVEFDATIIGNPTGSGMPVSYGVRSVTMTADADYTLTATELTYPIFRVQTSASLSGPHNIILPAVAGAKYDVFNNLGDGYSLTFKATTGTGIAVADGVRASIYFDGNNYVTSNTSIGGDLTPINNISQRVIAINGASVPVSGALTTGNLLQVTGSSALSYGPLNLGGGSNYVTGSLPAANQAPQIVSGDLTGTTLLATVVALRGHQISTTAPANQNVLTYSTGLNQWVPQAVTLSGDVTGPTTATVVTALQGRAVAATAPTNQYVLTWNSIANQWQPAGATGGPPSGPASGDLAGFYPAPQVVGLDGYALSLGDLGPELDGYVITWKYNDLQFELFQPTSGPPSGPAGGDLGNFYPDPSVFAINGASVPTAGSLVTGNVLQVAGPSTLSYGPINLAGGANYVTGQLPAANLGTITLTGGTTGSGAGGSITTTVVKVQNVTVSGTAPSTNQVLTATSSTTANWQTPSTSGSAGGDLSGTYPNPTVAKINGTSVPATPTANQVLVATSGTTATWQLIANAEISSSAAISVSKLASGTAGQLLLNNNTPTPTWTTMGGDATISATGSVDVTGLLTHALPALTDGYLNWTGSAWALSPVSGGGGSFTPGGDLSGTSTSQTVIGIQNIPVPSPSGSNTILTYNAGAYTWATNSTGITQLTGDVVAGPGSGSQSAAVVAIAGNHVHADLLTSVDDGYVLTWDNTDGYWTARPSTGSGFFVPTGTGIPHIISGVLQPVASLIVNADVSATAAIAGTKITPNFGSQNISTSGTVSGGGALFTAIRDSSLSTGIVHSDSSGNFSSSAVNLASANVTGILPTGNQAAQSLAGDATGTTAAVTVVAIQNNSIKAQSLTSLDDGYVLTWSGIDNKWEAEQPHSGPPSGPAGGDLGGFYPDPLVVGLDGYALSLGDLGPDEDGYVLTWDFTTQQFILFQPTSGPPSGIAGGDLGSFYPDPSVVALQGNPVAPGLLGPTQDGYALIWNNASTEWKAEAIITPPATLMGDVIGLATSNVIAEVQGNTIDLGGLLGALQDGYVLTWNNTAGKLEMAPPATISASTLMGDVTGTLTDNTVGQRKSFLLMGA